jgi:hypothetical protein
MLEETYDEFSELVQQDAALLPPSTSHTVINQVAASADDDENLEARRGASDREDGNSEDGGNDDGQPREEVVNDMDPFENEEDDDSNQEDPVDLDATEDVNVSDDDDAAQHAEYSKDRVTGDDEEGDVDDLTLANHASSSSSITKPRSFTSAPHFAISRIKALFKFANEASMREMGSETQCLLSTEAAATLSEALELMIGDMVTAGLGETQRKDKKTLTYDDISFVVSQLDRYSFLSDVVPPHPTAIKHRPVAASSAAAASRTVEADRKPVTAAQPRTRRPQQQHHQQPPPQGSGGPQRQLTLNFGSRRQE